MADVIGTPATAALLRRTAKDLPDGPVISRAGLEYAYRVPDHWRQESAEGMSAFRALARKLSPLLIELTGVVLIRRLDAIGELQRCNISFRTPNP
jgi:hypothetical protein